MSLPSSRTTRRWPSVSSLRWLAILLSLVGAAHAQEVGTVAAIDGSAEIGRSGTWSAATLGAAIEQGDALRTGRPGRVRVVFQDDSVINLGDDSHLIVDEQVFNPARGEGQSVIRLLAGKVSALVSDYYANKGSHYQVETVTAVAGVRGTDFVVKYDPRDEVTEIVGVSGRVEVHSANDLTGQGVFITAREITSIPQGELPTAPRRVSERLFRQYIEGMQFIGGGRAESLTAAHPVLAGAAVPKPDQAARLTAQQAGETTSEERHNERDVTSITKQSTGLVRGVGRLRILFPTH